MAGRTASEVQAETDARYRDDPEYRAAIDKRREEIETIRLERERKLAPFEADLKRAAVTETSDRMTGLRHADERRFEVAFDHLSRPGDDDWTRAWIVRSFEARGAVAHWDRLAAMYVVAEGPQEREALAAALSRSAKTANIEQMKRFVQTPELGSSRILFLRPIDRLDRKGGRDFVLAFVDDPELGIEADRIRRRVSRNS